MRISDWSSDVCSSDLAESASDAAASAAEYLALLMIRIVTGLRALETQKRRPHISAIAEPRRWTSASWRVERRQRGHKTVLQTSGTQARHFRLDWRTITFSPHDGKHRTEGRRVGQESVKTCKYR